MHTGLPADRRARAEGAEDTATRPPSGKPPGLPAGLKGGIAGFPRWTVTLTPADTSGRSYQGLWKINSQRSAGCQERSQWFRELQAALRTSLSRTNTAGGGLPWATCSLQAPATLLLPEAVRLAERVPEMPGRGTAGGQRWGPAGDLPRRSQEPESGWRARRECGGGVAGNGVVIPQTLTEHRPGVGPPQC